MRNAGHEVTGEAEVRLKAGFSEGVGRRIHPRQSVDRHIFPPRMSFTQSTLMSLRLILPVVRRRRCPPLPLKVHSIKIHSPHIDQLEREIKCPSASHSARVERANDGVSTSP